MKLLKQAIDVINKSKHIKQIYVICLGIVNYVNNTNTMGMLSESFLTVRHNK